MSTQSLKWRLSRLIRPQSGTLSLDLSSFAFATHSSPGLFFQPDEFWQTLEVAHKSSSSTMAIKRGNGMQAAPLGVLLVLLAYIPAFALAQVDDAWLV